MGPDPEGGLQKCMKEEAVVSVVQIQRKKKNSNKQSKRKCGHLEPECRQFCVSPVCKSCSGVTERGERGTQTRVIRKDRPGSPPEEF